LLREEAVKCIQVQFEGIARTSVFASCCFVTSDDILISICSGVYDAHSAAGEARRKLETVVISASHRDEVRDMVKKQTTTLLCSYQLVDAL
jgi:hypothetical protein